MLPQSAQQIAPRRAFWASPARFGFGRWFCRFRLVQDLAIALPGGYGSLAAQGQRLPVEVQQEGMHRLCPYRTLLRQTTQFTQDMRQARPMLRLAELVVRCPVIVNCSPTKVLQHLSRTAQRGDPTLRMDKQMGIQAVAGHVQPLQSATYAQPRLVKMYHFRLLQPLDHRAQTRDQTLDDLLMQLQPLDVTPAEFESQWRAQQLTIPIAERSQSALIKS